MHTINVVSDPTLTIFWLFIAFASFSLSPSKNWSKICFMLVCLLIFLHLRKKHLSTEPNQKPCTLCSQEIRQDLAVLFGRRKFPPNFFFRRRKFDYRCITAEFGNINMCKYFLYILTCFPGCNKRWWWRISLRKGFAKSWVCGPKLWAKMLHAYVFFYFYRTISWHLQEFFSSDAYISEPKKNIGTNFT